MPGRALVLGGGGVTGIGWEVGVLTGLARHGVMLADADIIIGTSAGSVVGVDLRASIDLETLFAAQLRSPAGEIAARLGPAVIARYAWAMLPVADPAAARRRIGAMALRARTGTETARRAVIESRLPVRDWPPGDLRITAVDAASASPTRWALAARCLACGRR
jgi:NTE family protein